MAALIANEQLEIKIWLVVVIGIPDEPTAEALMNKGLDSWDGFKDFTSENIESFCVVVRRPGGSQVVRNMVVPNMGFCIPSAAEIRLKQAVHLADYFDRIQQPSNSRTLTHAFMNQF